MCHSTCTTLNHMAISATKSVQHKRGEYCTSISLYGPQQSIQDTFPSLLCSTQYLYTTNGFTRSIYKFNQPIIINVPNTLAINF